MKKLVVLVVLVISVFAVFVSGCTKGAKEGAKSSTDEPWVFDAEIMQGWAQKHLNNMTLDNARWCRANGPNIAKAYLQYRSSGLSKNQMAGTVGASNDERILNVLNMTETYVSTAKDSEMPKTIFDLVAWGTYLCAIALDPTPNGK
jgi:hypothetical protein